MMRVGKTKIIGFVLSAVILTVALVVVFFVDGYGGMFSGPEIAIVPSLPDAPMDIPGDPSALRTTYRTVNLVQKHYLDPARVNPRAMLVAAMKGLQMKIGEVITQEEGDSLLVKLGPQERRFDLKDVDSPWMMLQRVREIFAFVQAGASDKDIDFQEVEYAAVNSMLETLDPHTVLLTPDLYRDMKDKTQGEFGGLGVVISIRDGALTVISPIDGTPAARAGLKSGDQVVKIGEVSTVSMPLNDAVTLMRGKPGTSVVLWIMRKGWEEPRAFEIVRAIIQVQSVESEMLSGNVGYVRIKDFQGNTAEHLREHLGRLNKRGARGLVIDLRNNPGGLLKAAIEVSDLFLEHGGIVTTAGQSPADRDVRRAKKDGDEPSYPLVVLVNSGSASASEIVAGALKNNGRALLVGERTFGKGSVQVLYDYNDGCALKMTSAQYLTPGDISIQSVGVVPHVKLSPMRADEEMLDLDVIDGYRESNLDGHLEEALTASMMAGRPDANVRYLYEPPKRETDKEKKEGDEKDGEGEDAAEDPPFEPDFQINLARDMVVQMASGSAGAVDVKALEPMLAKRGASEIDKLEKTLAQQGVDWTLSGDERPVQVEARISMVGDAPLEAGGSYEMKVTVSNTGPGTLERLHATTRSDFRPLDDKELAFGRLAAGQEISRTLAFKVPKDADTRVDDMLISFDDAAGRSLPSAAVRIDVEELPKPRFAHLVQLVDDEGGNGDGLLQPGERVKLLVDIDNVGDGPSLATYSTLKSTSGKEVFLEKGREKLEELPVGERRRAVFEFQVKPTYRGVVAAFELAVMDVDLKVYTVEKLELDITPPVAWKETPKRAVEVGADTPVLPSPTDAATPISQAPSGTVLELVGETEDGRFARVDLGDGRPGWISGKAAVKASDGAPSFEPVFAINSSPRLEVDGVERVVRRSTVRLHGRAVDETKVRCVYVFVGDKKVYFESNAGAEHPERMEFNLEVELEKGQNYITIVAEETPILDTRHVIAVRRDRVDGMPFITPWPGDGKPEPLGVIPER